MAGVKLTDWYKCYSGGWTNEIVPEAFSHPAKFARGLIRRIYEHAIEQGWLTEDRGAQYKLNGDLDKRQVKRCSFFRRLHERKYPHLAIDYEIVLCMEKKL